MPTRLRARGQALRLLSYALAGPLLGAPGAAAQEAWVLEGLSGFGVTTLASTAADPAVLLAGTDSGQVYRSADSGASWDAAAAGLPSSPILALAVDPSDAKFLYAGTEQGVFRSADAGATWLPSSTGMAGGAVHAIAVDPAEPAVVWASADEPGVLHVYRSADRGAAWQSIVIRGPGFGTPSDFDFVRSLVVRPGTSRVYAGWHEIVFWSDDGGSIWQKFPDVNLEVRLVRLDPFEPAFVYAGTQGGGVARSTDTAPWTFGAGIANTTVTALEADPGEPGLLYAAVQNGGVFRSGDRAESWAEAGHIPLAATALAWSASDGVLHAGTAGGVFRLGAPTGPVPRQPIVRPRLRGATTLIDPREGRQP